MGCRALALNPKPPASRFSLLLLIFPAKSSCAPAPKEKTGRPMPHLHLCKCLLGNPDYFFFPFWFCDQKSWLSLFSGFQPPNLLLLLSNRRVVWFADMRQRTATAAFPWSWARSSPPQLAKHCQFSVACLGARGGSFSVGGRPAAAFSPPLSPGFTCAFLEIGGGFAATRVRGRPTQQGGNLQFLGFRCYSYEAELENKI